jgi:hypothetical protein
MYKEKKEQIDSIREGDIKMYEEPRAQSQDTEANE